LMTAKDAVKCVYFARKGWYSVPVRAQLPDDFFARVLDLLRNVRPRPPRGA